MKFLEKLSVGTLTLLAAVTMGSSMGHAQQTTGTPGSPDATTTIDGKQLPPPPPKFGGVIEESAKNSKPWWPPRIVPPQGAPNVLLIMTDDQGYGVSGTFGGVIPTPALDRIAAAGLRYTQFNSTALCSPTRAALITGRNHHSTGFGVITELSTGYPGYDSIIGPENATVGTILNANGYATSWFGKNHNTPGFQYSVSGPFNQWPSGMGFQYFYGFMGGETDQWTPYLFRDHTQIFPWVGKPDYNLTTDLADEAIAHMRGLNAAAPEQPFFVYYVPGGSHSPHQPKKEWIDKFKGKFDMGWNVLREQIFANQKRLGVIPANTKLTPWPADLPEWESLSFLQKKLYARQAEVFAGYTAYTDHEIGRVIQAVEDMGKLETHWSSTSVATTERAQKAACRARSISLPPTTVFSTFPSPCNCCTTKTGARQQLIRTWRCLGRGRSTRPSNGPSRWRRILAERGRAWPSHGRVISTTRAVSATSSTTLSTSCPRSSRPRDQGAGRGRRHQAEGDRRREHGLHVRFG